METVGVRLPRLEADRGHLATKEDIARLEGLIAESNARSEASVVRLEGLIAGRMGALRGLITEFRAEL